MVSVEMIVVAIRLQQDFALLARMVCTKNLLFHNQGGVLFCLNNPW